MYIRCEQSFPVNFLSFYRVEIEFPTTLYRYDAGRHSATGNRVPKAIADKKRALGNVIMPRQSRENTTEEKRRMRNQRRKRKRLSRTDRERENREMRTQKERDAYSRAKGLARMYYGKWKALVEQNKKTLDKTKVSTRLASK